MSKRRRHAEERAENATQPAVTSGRLEPLLCSRCGAPQPVGDADTITCSGCGATTAVPDAYKMMRDAHRLSASDAEKLNALCADISRPPAAWERVAVVVGYGVGILTLVILALGALVGAIGGLIVGDKLEAGDTVTQIAAGIGLLICGFISVPFVGEWVVVFVTQLDADAATQAVSAPGLHLWTDVAVAGVLYFLGVVPIAVAWRTSQSISNLEELQSKLAAQPPTTTGGTSACRRCGAPLDIRPGALATRCIYCSADNLLTVPHAYAAKKKEDASALDVQVQGAMSAHEGTNRDDRRTMWTLLAVGPLLAPLLCLAGWLMHKILA